MKQIDAAKKYGLAQFAIATFLKKRKQIEEAVNSNEINPQRKLLKAATNVNIDAAVDSILINIENKVEEPFKAVNVKEAYYNIVGSCWEVTEKTFRIC
ncbi:hypothetical protein AVEN_142063-1 [Araneus ventricosus]|uniref:HTH psq-type domain-containing protein n=1 Tax=Araneus ventricosus TaxID=182803 RepID=A0A4Y2NLR4_ARAVE|nr:hypothetical protein AVEN_142063-1 [Araneus ventricosus]